MQPNCPFEMRRQAALAARSIALQRQFVAFVQDPSFPCVGARSALNRQRMAFGLYQGFGRGGSIAQLHTDLRAFSDEFAQPGDNAVSFVAMFDDPIHGESGFEALLWRHLQDLHEFDRQRFEWDPTVSSDPWRKDFSFSVAGRAFFIVGLHPLASRMARRSPVPCLVFNFHDQFENLRASNKYLRLQEVTRTRDAALQGSINPVLARFGEESEARQYSGRAVEDGWHCPFTPASRHAS